MSSEKRSELASEQVAGGLQNESPLWLHILGVRDPSIVPAISVMLTELNPCEVASEFTVGERTDHPIAASVKLPRDLADRLQVLLGLDSLSDGLGVQKVMEDLALYAVAAALNTLNRPR